VSHPIYVLAGEEFLVDEALDKVRAESGADPLSEAIFDARVSTADLLTALETPSLLGGRRLVVVHGARDLVKDQVETIARYLDRPSPHSVLVLVSSGRTKLDAEAKKLGAVVTLEAPKGRRLVSWIKGRAGNHNLRVDDRAAWTLIDTVGNELRDLDGALAQTASGLGPGARVAAADVKRLFARLADERIYVLTDAVGDRRLAPAMTALRRLFEQGEEPLVLFGALAAHIRRMLRVRRVADQGASVVGDWLGLPGWRAERLAKQARSYNEDELVDAMQILAATDLEMKGGDVPPAAALEGAVVRIVEGGRVVSR
jgi:DNA polymerase-3 subunit delta